MKQVVASAATGIDFIRYLDNSLSDYIQRGLVGRGVN